MRGVGIVAVRVFVVMSMAVGVVMMTVVVRLVGLAWTF